jgi:DNA-binding transcriptional regulator LsrR (DeoR family)
MLAKNANFQDPAPLLDLQVRATWLYYVEGLTQLQISRVMKTSRAKVIRLLAGARQRHRVESKKG